MSRIEEALRLAGGGQASAGLAEANKDTFTAPWSFEGEAAKKEFEPPVPAIQAPVASAIEVIEPVRALQGPVAVPEEDARDVEDHATLLGDDRSLPITGFAPEWAPKLAVSPNASPMLVEQFRRLAATLFHAQSASRLKIVMVTSPWAGDGKTMTSLNLSLVLSESYRKKVLLIDADLRRPSISNLSKIAPTCGLSDGLKAKGDQKLSVLKISDHLTLLPAGRPDPDPMSGLTSTRMRRILDEAIARFDWVILDAPPVGPVADANLLAAMTDAVLLVIRAGKTQYAPVQNAIESLGRERIFGVVLNGIDESTQDEYAQKYGQYYTSGSENVKK